MTGGGRLRSAACTEHVESNEPRGLKAGETPAGERAASSGRYVYPCAVRTPCAWLCSQPPPSKAHSPNGAKPNLSTSRIATRPWPWCRARITERRTDREESRSAPRRLVLKGGQIVWLASVPATASFLMCSRSAPVSKLLARSRIPSSLSSMWMKCAGYATSYGGTKRELEGRFCNGISNPTGRRRGPVIARLCTFALSRFAFSTGTGRSEPITTDSGPIRIMLLTLKGPACFASSERPRALPPPRSRACARLGIPRQCSRADGCNCGGIACG